MSKQLEALALALMLGISMPSNAAEAQKTGRPSGEVENPQVVKGQLVKIEGEVYVMKNAEGEKFKLHITQDTKIRGDIKVGDTIEVEITRGGVVETISLSGK